MASSTVDLDRELDELSRAYGRRILALLHHAQGVAPIEEDAAADLGVKR